MSGCERTAKLNGTERRYFAENGLFLDLTELKAVIASVLGRMANKTGE
jgi:hypothetical protein